MCSGSRPGFSMRPLCPWRTAALVDVAQGGEHRFRRLGGELAPGIGRAGLHDHRPALHRPRDVQRPAHGEIFPLVVQHVHLGRIEIDAVLGVADEGIVGKAESHSPVTTSKNSRARA